MPNISLIKIQTLSLNQIPYSPSKIQNKKEGNRVDTIFSTGKKFL